MQTSVIYKPFRGWLVIVEEFRIINVLLDTHPGFQPLTGIYMLIEGAPALSVGQVAVRH
jgi:hypothetical protein